MLFLCPFLGADRFYLKTVWTNIKGKVIKIGTKILSKSECQRRINEVTNTITILDFVNSKSAKLECSVCKQSWWGNPSNIYREKRGCPICVNQLIVVGYNELWTTHPKVA